MVVDEQGDPLRGVEVRAELPGGRSLSDWSDEDGTFRFHAPPGGEVLLRTDHDPRNGTLAPARTAVAFGTTGLVLRRLDATRVPVRVTLREAGTDDVLRGCVVVWRAGSRAQGDGVFAYSRRGEVTLEVHDTGDLRWAVLATGYRRASGDLPAPAPGEGGIRFEVALTPGLDRAVEVVDAITGAPIAGARLLDVMGEVLATSDARGVARLDGPPDLREVRVVADGYLGYEHDPFAPSDVHDRVELRRPDEDR